MNPHCVPEFEMEDDYTIPASSSALNRPRKSAPPEDEVMELLWQNGQVVMQSQNQRSSPSTLKKSSSSSKYDAVLPAPDRDITTRPVPAAQNNHQLFMQEEEMTSWLQYQIADDSFCADLLYSDSTTIPTNTNTATTTSDLRPPQQPIASPASKPPIHPPPTKKPTELQNFLHFSRTTNKSRLEPAAASSSKKVVRESTTVVDSSDTPCVGPSFRLLDSRPNPSSGGGAGPATSSFTAATQATAGKEVMTSEKSLSSSPGGSTASASASGEPTSVQKPPAEEDRKRKGREADDAECRSEDVEFESGNAKKQVRASTKRSRAAEVHNLSERRRRDRINEKMKALQELIPRCNKSDKASMLDEAIEYLKSLQLQVQMMSMGCGMVPMMFPGVQQYMPMGMGIGMGMGMGMEMGMNRPMMPFPNVLAGSPMPTGAAHLGPRFPMQAFHMQPIPTNDPTRVQAANQSDHMLNSLGAQNPNQSRMPNFADPYQQYFNPQQMQLPLQQQNPAMAQPSSSRGPENLEKHQTG